MQKRGLSEIVTTLLFVLLALGAVLMVWFLVRGLLVDSAGSADISQIVLTISVKSAEIDETAETASILIERGAGAGNIVGYNIIFEDEEGNSFSRRSDVIIDEFETKKIIEDYSDAEAGKIVKIEIYPIIKLPNGKEIIGGPVSAGNVKIANEEESEEEPPAEIPAEPVCGDGLPEPGEECDLGINNAESCTPAYEGQCTYCSISCISKINVGAYCGDGTLQSGDGEKCDDGNNINFDGCSETCKEEIPQENHLLLALKFEESTGNPILNSISGGIGAFSNNPESVLGATAGSGNAVNFVSSGTITGNYTFANGDLLKNKRDASISLWFNMPSAGAHVNNAIFSDYVNTASRFRVLFNSNRQISLLVNDVSPKSKNTGQGVFNFGTWYHLVATVQSDTNISKIYLNGAEQTYVIDTIGSQGFRGFYSPAQVGRVFVGAENASVAVQTNPYNGKVDELYVWDSALTDAEVAELYNSGQGKFYS